MRLRRGSPRRKRPRAPFDAMRPLRGVEVRRAQVDCSRRVPLGPIPEGAIIRSVGGETATAALGTSTFRITRSLHGCLSANSSAPSPVHWKGPAGGQFHLQEDVDTELSNAVRPVRSGTPDRPGVEFYRGAGSFRAIPLTQ